MSSGAAAGETPGQRETFEALLVFLSPGPAEDRGQAYARAREKLEDLFRWKGLASPEDLADETLDRVARRAREGLQAQRGPMAYVLGVARKVALEAARRQARHRSATPDRWAAPEPDRNTERYHQVLDACLQTLSTEDRRLLLDYHRGDGRGRIDGRRELADRLGMPLATLRVRAFRIRARVERCARKHMADDMDPDRSTQGDG